MSNAEAQLQKMREVKSAFSKGYLNFLWINMEIERLEEEIEDNQPNELKEALAGAGWEIQKS